MSVCPSVYKEQLGCHWADIQEILLLYIFRKTVDKIQVSLKSDKKSGYFAWRHILYHILLNSSSNEKCFGQKL